MTIDSMDNVFLSNPDPLLDFGNTAGLQWPWSPGTTEADLDDLLRMCNTVYDNNMQDIPPELLLHPMLPDATGDGMIPAQQQPQQFTPQQLPAPLYPRTPRSSPQNSPTEEELEMHSSKDDNCQHQEQEQQKSRSNRPIARTHIEHRYRNNLRSRFRELRCCVANQDPSGGEGSKSKLNKSSVLFDASGLITQLSSTVSQQQDRIEILNKHIRVSKLLLEELCGERANDFADLLEPNNPQDNQGPVQAPMMDSNMTWIP